MSAFGQKVHAHLKWLDSIASTYTVKINGSDEEMPVTHHDAFTLTLDRPAQGSVVFVNLDRIMGLEVIADA